MRRLFCSILLPVAITAITFPAHAECTLAQRQAIDLANEGDKTRMVDIDAAIAKYVQATQADPSSHRIFHKLAMAYVKKEDWVKAAQAEETAARLAPTFATYFASLGYARTQLAAKGQGAWEDARTSLAQALGIDPHLAGAHYDLAEVQLHLGDEQGALTSYTRSIQSDPHEASAWAALADLYIRLGYLKQAEQTLTQSLLFVEGPKRFALLSLRGEVLTERGDSNGAIAAYEEAQKSCGQCGEPGQAIAFFNLGAAYASASPPRKAEALQNLQSFWKRSCKGAAAQRYADQCTQAQQLAQKVGASLQ